MLVELVLMGVVALTHMYDQLGDVCFVQTKQLGGYAILL